MTKIKIMYFLFASIVGSGIGKIFAVIGTNRNNELIEAVALIFVGALGMGLAFLIITEGGKK